jgi:hypothetical protein
VEHSLNVLTKIVKQSLNALVIGGGMYVTGRGTSSYGTIMPALLEARKLGQIGKIAIDEQETNYMFLIHLIIPIGVRYVDLIKYLTEFTLSKVTASRKAISNLRELMHGMQCRLSLNAKGKMVAFWYQNRFS